MKKFIVGFWCWIAGHDTICLKHFQHSARTTSTAHKCLRCGREFRNQWDD